MKKIILVICISFISCMTVVAQENDPWVGTWTSVSYRDVDWDNSPGEDLNYANFKKVIRITKTNEGYNVRLKVIKVGDPNYTFYYPAMTVKKVEGSNMWLESYDEKVPFTVNDRIDSYRDCTHRYKLTFKQGGMHYQYYETYYTEYNRQMAFKKNGTIKWGGAGDSLELFTDDW